MYQQSGWQIIWPDSVYGQQYVLDVRLIPLSQVDQYLGLAGRI
jgi:hypothetical protein